MKKQITILKENSIEGTGLHTGNKSRLIFKPAPYAGYGIKFIRTDLKSRPEIEAICFNAVSELAIRGTVIEKFGVRIYTIEHVMSACFGLGIDNLIIEINNNELPILDGSAKIFTETLIKSGIKEFNILKEYYILPNSVNFKHGKTKISAYPSDHLEIECSIEFGHPFLKFQQLSIKNFDKDNYINTLASARTFCFDYEIENLQKKGLALGGTINNAIIIGVKGILNSDPLRYKDEFVRHKILDLIGDLYLAGKFIKAKIVANRPGHKNNIEFVKKFLKTAIVKKNEISIKTINNNRKIQLVETEKILNSEEILKYVPHRYPFLMIDKIKINITTPTKAIGYKCISGNEYFFQGHFPGIPIMPGVLIIEAMAQTSCVMFLSRPEMRGRLAYFISINNAKFRRLVKPGDVLELHVEIVKDSITRGKMKGKAYVDNKLTAEAEFTFIIVKKQKDSDNNI
ncbi:MAG: UDP-3-O-acyl-N-acetylglucosamine deacetylase [Endomicrobium sp.]|jgi:UDP-3-O-[3-hydroxymyristoyl] N-acetylglucosamine deacetylase/3-hydroxyacyl-[acyl-carrier-protein] dehydratase|nr:UDP-3-O-acyl-N-acetylglucosamine deacetylase [Endomicrobium sp.]